MLHHPSSSAPVCSIPELVLVNSHDRSSAYQLHTRLFRFVCGNGMIIADTTFERVTTRHSGFTREEVTAFAAHALRIRFEEETAWPITPVKLLESRRREDRGDDLWRTFDRVQKNLLQGGQRERGRFLAKGRRVPRTRAQGVLENWPQEPNNSRRSAASKWLLSVAIC